MQDPRVRLEPWGPDDFPLLERLLGDAAMTKHLGGPETRAKLVERQARYERCRTPSGRVFKIVDEALGAGVGSVMYWSSTWRGEALYEIGWSVLPEFQGRGMASAATRLALRAAKADALHPAAYALPGVDNAASNAICRKLGFTLVGPCDAEYPPGHTMRCNEWRIDLRDA